MTRHTLGRVHVGVGFRLRRCWRAAVRTMQSPPTSTPAATRALTRFPQAEIQKHIDREWVEEASVHGLLDYWVKNSIEPNGFIQENLDRQWKPWGTQREASINGQGRQLVHDRHRL